MGIGNSGEQESSRNAVFGPEMDLVQRHEKEYLYWLTRIPGFGAVTIRRIWEMAGSFERAYYIEGMELQKAGILKTEESCIRYDAWKKEFYPMEEEYYRLAEKGIRFITHLDPDYPSRLLSMYDFPAALYVKGDLPKEDEPAAAIIGARECSAYGRQTAEHMAKELAEAGVTIISGLARGIDGAGHKGALDGGGKTFAVLGCGVNICYPRSNYSLYTQIGEQGGLISEYPPDTPPLARNFPMRNRIISGLSDAVLVIEARKKSGSLITADLALEQGKEVFALPGRRIDPLSEGCNRLIAQGAGIVTKPEDVLDFFHIKCKNSCKKTIKSVNALAKSEKMVYSCLDSQPKHLEAVMKSCGLTAGECMTALLNLEMQGLILQPMNQYYVRKIV